MPEGLDAVIERAVAKDPAERYPSAGALIAAAREREGATPAATRVLSEPAERPTRADRRRRRRRRRGRARCAGGRLQRARRRRSRSSPSALVVAGARSLLGGDGVYGLGADRGRRRRRCGSPPARDAVWVTSEPRRHPDPARPATAASRSASRSGSAPASPASRSAPARSGSPTRARGEVLRRRPDSGRVAATDRRSAAAPAPIAFGGGRVWVADEDGAGVTAINAEGGRVFRRGIAAARGAAAARGRRRRPLGQQRLDRRGAPHRPRQRRRRRRRSRSAAAPPASPSPAASSGSPTAAPTRVTRVDPSIHAAARRPDRGRRPPGRDRRRHQHRLGRQRRRRHGQPDRPRKRRARSAPRSPSAPNPAPSRSATNAVWVADNGDGAVTRIEP